MTRLGSLCTTLDERPISHDNRERNRKKNLFGAALSDMRFNEIEMPGVGLFGSSF
jgi:hypothetical protein